MQAGVRAIAAVFLISNASPGKGKAAVFLWVLTKKRNKPQA